MVGQAGRRIVGYFLAEFRNLAQISFAKSLDKLYLCEMKKRMPSINALRSFEAAARHQSFKLAAAELSVSPAAIGYQVKRLEEDFGKSLFTRQHRAILLTPEGVSLMLRLSKGFEIIEAAWKDTSVPEPRRKLKVTAPVALVQRWLFDELKTKSRTDDEQRIAWDMTNTCRGLDESDIDVAIRNTKIPDPDLFSEPVLRRWFTPLARPDVARNIKTPSDLFNHGLIQSDERLDAQSNLTPWEPWFRSQGLDAPTHYEMTCTNSITAVDMAIETGHIVIGGFFVAADHIKEGRLVEPFDVAICLPSQLWFMCQKGRETEPEMLWLRQAIQDSARRLRATATHLKMYDLHGKRFTEELP